MIKCENCGEFTFDKNAFKNELTHKAWVKFADMLNKKLGQYFDFIISLRDDKFTGSVELHFSQGGISKIIKHEQVK